jgi:hypothetical protein
MSDTFDPQMPVQERAAHLLVTPGALVQLSLPDAREVVRYMQPRASMPTPPSSWRATRPTSTT